MFGGVPYLAEQAERNATTLYRTLSPRGNPERLAVQSFKPTAVP
jgi:DNA-binding phage protein